MSTTENNVNTTSSLDFERDQVLNLREVLTKYLYHWPVFVLGLVICMLGAYFYLRYTQPIYQVTSTLLIKDQKKSASADILNKFDQGGVSKDVDNEIEILKSRTLMTRVVERLNLNVQYRTEGRVIAVNAYENRPVNLIPVDFKKEFYNRELQLTFPNQESYLLKDVLTGKNVRGQINQLHKTIFGVYKIEKINGKSISTKDLLKINISDVSDVAGAYLGGLTIEPKSNRSTVLILGYKTPVIKLGEDILNTLVQVYNEAALLDKNKTTQRTMEFIDERLAPLSGELTDVEKDVESFKSSQGLTDITSQAELYLGNVKANDARLSDVNIKIAVVEEVEKFISSKSIGEKLPSTMGIEDPVLMAQIEGLSQLYLKRNQMLATMEPANPLLEPINKQIDDTRLNIKTSISNIKEVLLNTKRLIESNNENYHGSIKKIPGQERQFVSIKRQQAIKEALYLYLLQRKEETALSYASSVADSRLIDPALGNQGPIKPRRQVVYLVALLVGLILPAAYIMAKDLLNNKVNSKGDISRATHAPLLGELVYNEGSDPIVVNADSRNAIAEQFRAIRTNLQFSQGKQLDGEGRVTLFTSSMSGEGKSFVATNLGAVLAISGRKTIVLELDLRKPKIIKYLKLSTKVGLSNYLIGKSSYEDVLLNSGVHPNLFVMGSGPIPPNPSELLIQKEMRELIAYLRTKYDEIIIDAPPVGLVTDAQILAEFADTTIYIVRHGVTLKSQLAQFDAIYRQNKFPRLNLILNGVQVGGSYGYGYGYGYGYYSDDHEKDAFSVKGVFKEVFKRF
jgi:tyrosine-protein kinase Etk/Wzc